MTSAARHAPSRQRHLLGAVDGPLRDFYAEDDRRARSSERDLGLRWRSRDGSTYRVAWIAETEEVYSVRHGEHSSEPGVRVLGRLSRGMVERSQARWREVCDSGADDSYDWLLEQPAIDGSAERCGRRSRHAEGAGNARRRSR
jgi:hypothetical protein